MTVEEAYKITRDQLQNIYESREAAHITDMLFENICGLSRTQRIMQQKSRILLAEEEQKLFSYNENLLAHKPIQYVLHEAWFAGKKFYVDENVLIPRPETEELCEWIFTTHHSFKTKNISILDVGTGSGCIAITLKNKFPNADVYAVDISAGALEVASKNAAAHNASINFCEMNFLDRNKWNALPQFDIIVSNPPYIKQSEAEAMQKNVLDHEPHTALFVKDDDAFIFYREISLFAQTHLRAGGSLYFEINEMHGDDIKQITGRLGFINTEIKKDIYGKSRMIRGNAQK